jgi:hypothetical protein
LEEEDLDSINITIRGDIFKDATSGWTCVAWPESRIVLGTGKPVKIICRVNGLDLPVTIMPMGNGSHMIPLKQEVRKKLKKDVGDTVEIVILSRL